MGKQKKAKSKSKDQPTPKKPDVFYDIRKFMATAAGKSPSFYEPRTIAPNPKPKNEVIN